MTPAEFSVTATSRFERDYRNLLKRHPDLAKHYAAALPIFKRDPYNRSRLHAIKKLEGVAPGDGQYRFRSGRFRFRYDIAATIRLPKILQLAPRGYVLRSFEKLYRADQMIAHLKARGGPSEEREAPDEGDFALRPFPPLADSLENALQP